jgi:hydrogenase expression/formation protein HypC
MKIVSIEGGCAKVEAGGVSRTASLQLVEDVQPGDFVIVHAGFAIEKIDQLEAVRTLEMIKEIASIEEDGEFSSREKDEVR